MTLGVFPQTFDDNWALVSSVTPTSGASSIAFSSLGGYKKYLLIATGIDITPTASVLSIRINSDTATNYFYGFQNNTSAGSASFIDAINTSGTLDTTGLYCSIIIDYANKTTPKFLLNGFGCSRNQISGYYLGTSAVTNISIVNNHGSTFNATGTVSLYGVAA